MKIVCISENIKKLKELKALCSDLEIFDEVNVFYNEYDVSEYLKVNIANVILLDADVKQGKGIQVIDEIRKMQLHVNIIMFSDRKDYAYDAYQKHVSGYILWPITEEKLLEELDYLRFTLPKHEKRVFAKTFGIFELFIDGRPVLFKNGKTKELFAYLLDQGIMCSNKDIISALWNDEEDHNSYLKKLRVDLLETLKWDGCDELILKERGALGINQQMMSSDLFEWKAGTEEGIHAFDGEYMSQYEWARKRLSLFE